MKLAMRAKVVCLRRSGQSLRRIQTLPGCPGWTFAAWPSIADVKKSCEHVLLQPCVACYRVVHSCSRRTDRRAVCLRDDHVHCHQMPNCLLSVAYQPLLNWLTSESRIPCAHLARDDADKSRLER